VLVAVVEAGTFSAAALRLGVTKSAVSRRISRLEQRLGVRLLQRTTRRLCLTEAGERFYFHASQAVEAALRAERAATELQDHARGVLRVISLMSFGALHVVPLLPEFLRRYPEVHVDLILDDRAGRILDGDFDIALRAGGLPDSSLVARTLVQLHSVLCASPSYVERCGAPERPSDLTNHNGLTYSYSDLPSTWTFLRDGHAESIEITGTCKINNSEALCKLVIEGTGLSRLPMFIAAPYITSGQLVPLLTDYQMPSKDLVAVLPGRRFVPQKVRVFMNFVVDALGTGTPWGEIYSRPPESTATG